MIFDWTISLGNILSIVGFGFAGLIFVMMMRADLTVLSARVGAVEKVLNDVAQATVNLARHDERLNNMDVRLAALTNRLDDVIVRTAEGQKGERGERGERGESGQKGD